MSTNFKIIELHYYIWNHHEKCIQINTNMHGIGSEMSEKTFEICFNFVQAKTILRGKTKKPRLELLNLNQSNNTYSTHYATYHT